MRLEKSSRSLRVVIALYVLVVGFDVLRFVTKFPTAQPWYYSLPGYVTPIALFAAWRSRYLIPALYLSSTLSLAISTLIRPAPYRFVALPAFAGITWWSWCKTRAEVLAEKDTSDKAV